jgi:nitrilase
MSSAVKQTRVRVAVVQAGSVPFQSEACVDKAVRLIEEAAAAGAKVIVFPEAFITGYPKGLNYGLVVGARDPAGREEFRLYLDAAIDVPGPLRRPTAPTSSSASSSVTAGPAIAPSCSSGLTEPCSGSIESSCRPRWSA